MNPPHASAAPPAGEPKDGDFVAYLAQIEKRQLEALRRAGAQHVPPAIDGPRLPQSPQPAPADSPMTSAQADALRAQLKAGAGDARQMLAAAVFALLGLFFIVQALLSDAGIVGLLIGGFLWWRAAVAVRRLTAGAAGPSRDLAARLVDTLRAAQSQSQSQSQSRK